MTACERKSHEALTQLASHVVRGNVYLAFGYEEYRLEAFMILKLCGAPEETGAVYEFMDSSSPRSMDLGQGMLPMFLSAKFVHIEDCEFLREELLRMLTALGFTVSADGRLIPPAGGHWN